MRTCAKSLKEEDRTCRIYVRMTDSGLGAEGQPLKVTGDGSIEQEHGLVSYRADTVLYVNVSGAPTTIDGRSIGPAGAPVTLTSGSVLGLGDTRLLATTFTEFVATSD